MSLPLYAGVNERLEPPSPVVPQVTDGPPNPSDRPTLILDDYATEPTHFGGMVGRSAVMRKLFDLLQRAANSEATVLIEGETGTGKEASSESIHSASRRRNGPFVVIDCANIPPQLLESELFGHERGSFTGAVSARAGAFETASGGTIFLDEIGELSVDLQPRILRVLERKQIKRIGNAVYQNVDVRVIAATNRSLKAEVAAGRFRQDLYYRLAVFQIRLPPLRERLSDLQLLVTALAKALCPENCPQATFIKSPEFVAKLAEYHWPGNIRQLRNYIERCVALGESVVPPPVESLAPPIRTSLAPGAATPAGIDITQPLKLARNQYLASFEREYLEASLAAHPNNVSAAARSAGVDRAHFYRLLGKHGLKAP